MSFNPSLGTAQHVRAEIDADYPALTPDGPAQLGQIQAGAATKVDHGLAGQDL
jgi:hypothetical protein